MKIESTDIEPKRNNELFFYSTSLSIQSYAAYSMLFFPKSQNIAKILFAVVAAGYLT